MICKRFLILFWKDFFFEIRQIFKKDKCLVGDSNLKIWKNPERIKSEPLALPKNSLFLQNPEKLRAPRRRLGGWRQTRRRNWCPTSQRALPWPQHCTPVPSRLLGWQGTARWGWSGRWGWSPSNWRRGRRRGAGRGWWGRWGGLRSSRAEGRAVGERGEGPS